MKNKMLKRSHLSERACQEIIQLFADDLTATQIAGYTRVSRVTINNYLRLIRTHIARYCEALQHYNPMSSGHAADEMLVNRGLPTQEENHNTYYGFYRWNTDILTDELRAFDRQDFIDLQKGRPATGPSLAGPVQQRLKKYDAIADFEGWRLYRTDQGQLLNTRVPADDIGTFWGNTKNRLIKFRGLNKNTLYLHVKESEFRFNNRDQDINCLLLNIIYKYPLHLSKPVSEVKTAVYHPVKNNSGDLLPAGGSF